LIARSHYLNSGISCGMTDEDAKAMILEGRAKHFDPVLVDCFMQIHTEFEVLSKASLLDDPQSTVAQPKMV
ncbi:MAG: hypothetical protein L0G80_17680, partial [Shewanella sp.]|nr:hypothetical protein [Shewanella sp.]MDN5529631.1 hypothetical protein [Shewanella sp.]